MSRETDDLVTAKKLYGAVKLAQDPEADRDPIAILAQALQSARLQGIAFAIGEIAAIEADWREDGSFMKVNACEYLRRHLGRAASSQGQAK